MIVYPVQNRTWLSNEKSLNRVTLQLAEAKYIADGIHQQLCVHRQQQVSVHVQRGQPTSIGF
jgi:hypothetical protein